VTFQPLMDILQQMHSLYAKLIELGQQKKDQVIRNQLNELAQTLTQESKLIRTIASMEDARIQALAAFQREAGLKEDPNMRLEDTAKYCTSLANKQALQNIMAELSTQTMSLKALNESNQLLVHHALEIVNHTLDLLVGSPEDEMTYQNPAQSSSYSKRNSYFDTRA